MKIQCSCGMKYAFDLTPEMGRVPITFVCQKCGVDSSQMVNQLIRQELGLASSSASVGSSVPAFAPPPTTEPVTVRVNYSAANPPHPSVEISPAPPPTPPPAPPSSPSVRVTAQRAPATAAAAAAPATDAPQVCLKHPGQLTTNRCLVCKKPICPKCMEIFGYVCSALCKGRAETQGIQVPAYAHLKSAAGSKQGSKVALILVTSCLLLLSGAGFWTWYKLSGSQPKRLFSVRYTEASSSGLSRFFPQHQLLLLHAGKLSRQDLKTGREIWSQPLIDRKKLAEEASRIYEASQAGRTAAPV